MELAPLLLLKLTLVFYVGGSLAALICWRREKLGSLLTFGSAAIGGLCGMSAAFLSLAGYAGQPNPHWEFLGSAIPYLKFSARFYTLSGFSVLIVSILALALSVFSIGYDEDKKRGQR